MTTTAPLPTPTGSSAAGRRLRPRRRFPRWGTAACFGAALAVLLLLDLVAGLNIAVVTVGTVLLGTVLVYVIARAIEGSRSAKDRLVTCLVYSAFGIAMVPLVSLAVEVVRRGAARFDGQFFTWSLLGVLGEGGGAYHAIMGTLEITAFATVISVPIGLLTAIYLVEYGPKSKLGRGITFFVDVMTGIPSIVAGLFAYALFVLFFGPGVRMGAAGSVALAVLMIPVVVRASEEMLKLVPNELREAAYALGVPKWLTVVKVVLRTAAAGLVTGVMLSIARVIGETAPLLIVAGVVDSSNFDLFEGRMMTLPVYVFRQYSQGLAPPGPDSIITINYDRAWAAALTLILIVMVLNLIARLVARIFSPKTGR
jgi:phosphate transport system permease protein